MVLSRDFDGRCICAHAVAENLWTNLVVEGIKFKKVSLLNSRAVSYMYEYWRR